MSDVLLQIKGLCTYFYTSAGAVKAVDGIDLSISRGETLGLVGESGCGKSVTGLSIMQLVQPPGRIVKGEILFDGRNLLELDGRQMRRLRGNRISMIFQEPMTSLNPVLQVGRQVAESIRLHQHLSRRESIKHATEILKKVGISDPEKRSKEYPHQLSGGMRQRVMVAMALACYPELMIADEPTTALDVSIQAQILDLMNELKEDFHTSMFLITHDFGVIAEMAQQVAVMYAGKIVEYSSSLELFRDPRHPYTLGLMDSIPSMDKPVPENRMLRAIPGVVPGLLDLPKGCSFRDRCSRTATLCSEEIPPLSTITPDHFVRCWYHEKQ